MSDVGKKQFGVLSSNCRFQEDSSVRVNMRGFCLWFWWGVCFVCVYVRMYVCMCVCVCMCMCVQNQTYSLCMVGRYSSPKINPWPQELLILSPTRPGHLSMCRVLKPSSPSPVFSLPQVNSLQPRSVRAGRIFIGIMAQSAS